MALDVAKTIFDQLGGNAFARMTGARDFVGDKDGLMFKLPGASGFCKDGINCVQVKLKADDTYLVRFERIRRSRKSGILRTLVAEHDGVYCDQLQEIFRRETGLETRMPKVLGLS